MTFTFSKSSLSKLERVDPRLQLLANEVLKISPIDFAITSGYRTTEEQQKLYKQSKSKLDGITKKSKHQANEYGLSEAIDICPYINGKLDYTATDDLFFIIGLFYAKAKELQERYEMSKGNKGLDFKLRLGALWDSNSIKRNSFVDGYHIEIEN
jgi:hypothetical protein